MTTASGPIDPNAAPGQLCQSCGLCCDGSFFGTVELRPEDDALTLARLLPLEPKGDRLVFRQPCPVFRGGCCTVYEQRPHVCRRYRCRVLRGVEAQPEQIGRALEKVSRLRAHLARLKELLRAAGFHSTAPGLAEALNGFRTASRAARAAGDTGFLVRHALLVLHWKKTAWLLHEEFDEKAAGRMALPVDPPARQGEGHESPGGADSDSRTSRDDSGTSSPGVS